MLYAVRFFDKPDCQDIRAAHMDAHLTWLDDNSDVVLIGGSLRNAPGEPPVGGMWLVDATDRDAIEALLRTDPFWIHGLRAGYEIFFWRKAFPDRKVLI